MSGIERLKSGDFNLMHQEQGEENVTIITLFKREERIKYKFAVKNLYHDDEEVLWEEVTPTE